VSGGDRSDSIVLCYHAVSESWPAVLSVTPTHLAEQLDLLRERGYRGIPFSEAVLGPPPGRTVAITFDDGLRSVFERALPILSRFDWPATVFALTDFVGAPRPMTWPGVDAWLGGPHEGELTPLTWQQLGRLRELGWEIGSHTRTHARLTELGDAELERELGGSREELTDRFGSCTSLAYPYGDHDERTIEAARRAGYSAAGTLPSRLHAASPLRFPRIGIHHADGSRRFALKLSPSLRKLRRTAVWDAMAPPLRRVRTPVESRS